MDALAKKRRDDDDDDDDDDEIMFFLLPTLHLLGSKGSPDKKNLGIHQGCLERSVLKK
jgi:hypothetical protein